MSSLQYLLKWYWFVFNVKSRLNSLLINAKCYWFVFNVKSRLNSLLINAKCYWFVCNVKHRFYSLFINAKLTASVVVYKWNIHDLGRKSMVIYTPANFHLYMLIL